MPGRIRWSIRIKLLLTFTVVSTLALVLPFYWFYRFGTQLAVDTLQSDLKGTAAEAANVVHADALEGVVQSGQPGDPAYTAIYRNLRGVQGKDPMVHALYTLLLVPGRQQMEIGVSTDPSPEGTRLFRRTYDVANRADVIQALDHPGIGQSMVGTGPGTPFAGYAPILGDANQVVGVVEVDPSAGAVATVQKEIEEACTGVLLGFLAVLITAIFFASSAMTRSVRIVARAAETLERGEHIPTSDLERIARGTDELAELARVFLKTAEEVQRREAALKREVAQLRIEIDVAKQEKQVQEITETDFFRDLQQKAARLRTNAASAR